MRLASAERGCAICLAAVAVADALWRLKKSRQAKG